MFRQHGVQNQVYVLRLWVLPPAVLGDGGGEDGAGFEPTGAGAIFGGQGEELVHERCDREGETKVVRVARLE